MSVEEKKAPWEVPVQKLSIKMLDVARLGRDYRVKHKLDKEAPLPNLKVLTEFIVTKYNEENPLDNEEEPFHEIDFPQATWNKIKTKGFSLLAYHSYITIPNPLSTMLKALDIVVGKSKEISFLFLLYRTRDSVQEIFALTSGNRGFKPAQPYSDYLFPRKIALRLLNPTELSKETSKQIIGPVLASTEILRSAVLFDPNSLQKIFTEFQASMRVTASLHKFEWFQLKSGKVPKKPVEIGIREGLIRFHKKLPFEAYPTIVNHLAKIFHGKETKLYPSGEAEVDAKEEFAFLEYFTPVSMQRHFALDKRIIVELAVAILEGHALDWTFAHPHVSSYFKAHSFRLRYKKDAGEPVVVEWKDYRKNFSEILADLREIPHLRLKQAALEREIPKIFLDFHDGNGWDPAPLLSCLSGQAQLEVKGIIHTFFKLNQRWYEISSNLLMRVHEEFRQLLVNCLLQPKETGFLPHPWQARPQNLTEKAIKEKLEEEDVSDLFDLEVSFVSSKGKVRHKTIEGEICLHPVMRYYKSAIEELLSADKITLVELEKKLGNKSFALEAWEELKKKRTVAQKKTVTIKNQPKEVVIIKNPFLPKRHPLFGHVAKLQEWCLREKYTMHEGPYNEGYLYTVNNNNKPYTLAEEGWLVGDRIEVEGIELFDIAHYTKDHLFLYHVKKSFDKARDALSQVMNAARVLSKTGNQRAKFLKGFFDESVKEAEEGKQNYDYYQAARTQLRSWGAGGQKKFLELFETRTIVFVYALADDRASVHTITKAGLTKEQFSKKDFSTEKTEAVAAKIFDSLKQQQYLDKEGKRGARFAELYRCEALNFEEEELQPYSKFAWQILTGDISFFGSLIGRMDLLHTRAQVEGLGFGFKLCQIRNPDPLAQEGIDVRPLLWNDLNEEVAWPLRQQMPEVLFYRAPHWFESAQCWMKQPTLADGSCGLHALFGVQRGGALRCNVESRRAAFVEKLRVKLNVDEDGFDDEALQNLYIANLTSMIEEAEKPDLDETDPSYQLRRCSKLLFENSDAFQEYLDKGLRQRELELHRKMFEGAKKQSLLTKTLKEANPSISKGDFFESLTQNEDLLHAAMTQASEELRALSQKSKTYDKLTQDLDKWEGLKTERQAAKEELLQDAEIMANFLTCLARPDYWLNDDEMQMLAYLYDIRLEILRVDIDGDYGCNNYLNLSPREGDERQLRVVHGDGAHYSRCAPFDD